MTHAGWTAGADGVLAPEVTWRGTFHHSPGKQTVDSHLELGALHLDLGPRDVDVSGLRDDASIALKGDLADPTSRARRPHDRERYPQDFAPEYPLGDVALHVAGERETNGLLRLTDVAFQNGKAGTTLGVSGNVQLGAGRHTLSLTTNLAQGDLGRLTRAPERFTEPRHR